MADIAFPGQQNMRRPHDDTVGAPLFESEGPVELLPNPDFVFPRRAPAASQNLSSSTGPAPRRPASYLDLSASRPTTSPRLSQRRSASTLPSFNFNPSAEGQSTPTTVVTPPHSPAVSSPSTPSRGMHRRGGSEFIGGDARPGSVALLNSSPVKADCVGLGQGPTLQPATAAGRRRGHVHRRSGAISCHDLATILQPTSANAQLRSGSAPTTPLEPIDKSFEGDARRSHSQPSLMQSENEESTSDEASTPPRTQSRTRVGFSDKIEYIRPLSTISSETESSMSTIRGHSVSNSLSSIVSGGSTPPSARKARQSLDTTFENASENELERRPSTASDVLGSPLLRAEPFDEELDATQRPSSANATSSPTTGMKTFTFGRPPTPSSRRTFSGSFKPSQGREQNSRPPSPLSNDSNPSLAQDASESLPRSPKFMRHSKIHERDGSPQRKTKKPKRVRSWANSLISRKPKNSGEKTSDSLKSPEDPAALPLPPSPMGLGMLPDFDADNTVTIVTPPVNVPEGPLEYFERSHRRSASLDLADSDSRSALIDMDAALGPFNTPSPGSTSRGPARRRKMYSAGGPYSGLGLLNHRRTESAPELVPFDAGASSITTRPMADVFEEEEEDDLYSPTSDTSISGAGSINSIAEEHENDGPGIGIQVVDTDDVSGSRVLKWNFQDAFPRGKKDPDDSPKSLSVTTTSPVSEANSLANSPELDAQDASPVEIVEDYEEPRAGSLPRSSDSTITPTLKPTEGKEPAPLISLGLPLPQDHLRTPDTVTFSSPDFRSSQSSFDTHRLGTATSSIADSRTANSSLLGEPGPELRVSVDDVPSLTSSRSTMNSGVNHGSPFARTFADRSGSVASESSSTLPETRRNKRSSIASLSRLVGGTFGEKSKLSIEQRPSTEGEDTPRPVKKKKNRLSKMMHFWKSKESLR